jgi:hypothetical protein
VIATRDDYTPGLMSRVVELSDNKPNGHRSNGSTGKVVPTKLVTVAPACTSWNNKQVCQWLETIGLKKFIKSFSTAQIDGDALDSMRYLEISDEPPHSEIWASLGINSKQDKIAMKRQLDALFQS